MAVALAALASLLPRGAAAGAWTKGAGELYVKLSEALFFSDRAISSSGTIAAQDYFSITTAVYYEVGLFRGFHLQGYVPHVIGRNRKTDEVYAGAGDLLFGTQYEPPLSLPFKLAARVEWKVPLYDAGASRDPALGDGNVDLTLWLVIGASLPRLPVYAWGELGYRWRSGVFIGHGPYDDRAFADSLAWLAQVGGNIYRGVLVAATCTGVQALSTDLYTRSIVSIGPTLYVPVYRGLALEAYLDAVVRASNAGLGVGFGAGVSYNR